MKNFQNFFEKILTFEQFKEIHKIEKVWNSYSDLNNVFDVYLYGEKKGKMEMRPGGGWIAYYSNPVFNGDDYIQVNGERLGYIDTFQDKLSAAYAISIYKDLIINKEFAARKHLFKLASGGSEVFIYLDVEDGNPIKAGEAIQSWKGRWAAHFLDLNNNAMIIGKAIGAGIGIGNEGGYSDERFAGVALVARWVLLYKGMPLPSQPQI